MVQIEIYWQDLTEKKQKEIMKDLNNPDHNWDVFPMCVIDIEEEEN